MTSTSKPLPISPDRIEIARRIKKLRKMDFKDQADFGDFLGIEQPTVSKIERGLNNLTHPHLIKLAKEKKWNPKYITFGVGNTHLTKEDIKRNLVTDVSEVLLEIDMVNNRMQRLEDENMYLLRLINELRQEISSLK